MNDDVMNYVYLVPRPAMGLRDGLAETDLGIVRGVCV